jgi:SPP1 gp7 family putative phage head morphogenesis protein
VGNVLPWIVPPTTETPQADTKEPITPPPTAGLFQESIIARAKRELLPLYDELLAALDDPANINQSRVDAILKRMWTAWEQASVAGKLAGMVTPFAPQLNAEVPTSKRPAPIRELDLDMWPAARNALDWLSDQITQFPNRLANLVSREQVKAATHGADVDARFLDRLNRELAESIAKGEGRDAWRERLAAIVETKAGFDETISRTATHRSYLEGQREIQREPVIADVFPYRQYFATMDNRVRPEHAAMNGKIYHKDSSLARQAESLLDSWNCRCSEIVMTEDEALRIGVSPGGRPVGSEMVARELIPV